MHASNDNGKERIIMKKINKLLSGTALALALSAGFGAAHADISAAGNQTIGSLAGVAGSTVALGANTLTFGNLHQNIR